MVSGLRRSRYLSSRAELGPRAQAGFKGPAGLAGAASRGKPCCCSRSYGAVREGRSLNRGTSRRLAGWRRRLRSSEAPAAGGGRGRTVRAPSPPGAPARAAPSWPVGVFFGGFSVNQEPCRWGSRGWWACSWSPGLGQLRGRVDWEKAMLTCPLSDGRRPGAGLDRPQVAVGLPALPGRSRGQSGGAGRPAALLSLGLGRRDQERRDSPGSWGLIGTFSSSSTRGLYSTGKAVLITSKSYRREMDDVPAAQAKRVDGKITCMMMSSKLTSG